MITTQDAQSRAARPYVPPSVRDFGNLTALTADQGVLFDVTRGALGLIAQVSIPVPGPGDGGVLNTSGTGSTVDPSATTPSTTTPTSTTPLAGVLGDQGTGGSTSPGNGGDGGVAGTSGSGGGAGGSDGRLPFTGLAVIGIASVGAALAGAGTVLRRVTRRNARDTLDS